VGGILVVSSPCGEQPCIQRRKLRHLTTLAGSCSSAGQAPPVIAAGIALDGLRRAQPCRRWKLRSACSIHVERESNVAEPARRR
jgi:hypothetical protein